MDLDAPQPTVQLAVGRGWAENTHSGYEGRERPRRVIRKFGAERFKMLIDGARSVTEYQMGVIRAKYDLGSTEQRGAYLQEAAGYLATVPSAMERELYIGKLAEEAEIPRDAIRESVNRELHSEIARVNSAVTCARLAKKRKKALSQAGTLFVQDVRPMNRHRMG